MNEVIRAAAALQAVCEAEHWRFCFIGGLAVQRWGEPRETVDVDLTLLTGFGDEGHFVSTLLDRFEPRVDRPTEFPRANRVLLLKARSGVGLDIALGGLTFEELAVSRATLFTYPPDVPLRTCSAEDFIVFKAFADRPEGWVDVDGIILRQTGHVDWDYDDYRSRRLWSSRKRRRSSRNWRDDGLTSTAERMGAHAADLAPVACVPGLVSVGCHGPQSPVLESLYAFPFHRLACVDVTLGIDGHGRQMAERSSLVPAVAE